MTAMLLALAVATAPISLSSGLSDSASPRPSVRRKHRTRKQIDFPKQGDWTVDGQVELVSDYRPGGISSTNGKPAIQAELNLAHRSGLFANIFASTLAANGGDRVEIDLAGGYARSIGRTTLTALGTAYLFPGVPRSAYVEFQVGAEQRIGRATLGASAAWCPPQANIGGKANLYLGLDGSIALPSAPLVLDASIGREDGAFGNRKLDWSLGGHVQVHRIELSLTYQDAARTGHAAHSGATLIGGIALTF